MGYYNKEKDDFHSQNGCLKSPKNFCILTENFEISMGKWQIFKGEMTKNGIIWPT